MANVDTITDAMQTMRSNFANAQKEGKIGKTAVFDPSRVKQVSAGENKVRLVYTTASGGHNTKIKATHAFPLLATNYL